MPGILTTSYSNQMSFLDRANIHIIGYQSKYFSFILPTNYNLSLKKRTYIAPYTLFKGVRKLIFETDSALCSC